MINGGSHFALDNIKAVPAPAPRKKVSKRRPLLSDFLSSSAHTSPSFSSSDDSSITGQESRVRRTATAPKRTNSSQSSRSLLSDFLASSSHSAASYQRGDSSVSSRSVSFATGTKPAVSDRKCLQSVKDIEQEFDSIMDLFPDKYQVKAGKTNCRPTRNAAA